MWLWGGLSCVWFLLVIAVTFVYRGFVRNMTYYGIQPDEYHTFDKEAMKDYWNTDKRWRAHKGSRAILIAIPVLLVGLLVIFFGVFTKVSTGKPADPVAIAVTQTLASLTQEAQMTGTPVP
jgi:hypothetical protein